MSHMAAAVVTNRELNAIVLNYLVTGLFDSSPHEISAIPTFIFNLNVSVVTEGFTDAARRFEDESGASGESSITDDDGTQVCSGLGNLSQPSTLHTSRSCR